MTVERKLGPGENLQVRTRAVVLVTASLLVLLTVIAFGFMLIFANRIGVGYAVRHEFPAPAIIPNERSERLAMEARQRRVLAGQDGRMPIEQAMQAVVARGPHAFDPVK
jgi:hypothetical protein